MSMSYVLSTANELRRMTESLPHEAHDEVVTAILFAISRHGDQRRKYDNMPYAIHPIRVAQTVAGAGYGHTAIIAALLHDVLEDTTTSADEIRHAFGLAVMNAVLALTDEPALTGGVNRAGRKSMDRKRIAKAPEWVHAIKYADILDNLPSITLHEPGFAKVVIEEVKLLLDVLGEPADLDCRELRRQAQVCLASAQFAIESVA